MQLGFKAVNPSSHEVNKIWNWIKTKSKPNSFFTSGKQWKAAAPPRRGKAAENWRKVKMEVLEAVNGGPLQFWNRKLLMLIYNSSSSLHCICTFKKVDMEWYVIPRNTFFNTLCKPSSATAHCLYIIFTLLHCLHYPHCLRCFYTAHTAYTTYAAKHCLQYSKNANIYIALWLERCYTW